MLLNFTEAAYKHRQENSLGHSRQMPCELSPYRTWPLQFHDGHFLFKFTYGTTPFLFTISVLRPHVVPLFGIESQEAEILDLEIDLSFGHPVPSVRAPEDVLAAPIFIQRRPCPWYTIRSQSHLVLLAAKPSPDVGGSPTPIPGMADARSSAAMCPSVSYHPSPVVLG